MEGMMQYPPGDSRMIDKIVHQLKSQGIFDQFRKECLADVDTKPAYQNLHQRVEGSVSGFLSSQEWRPDLNKNQLRDSLRKHIHESGFLDIGVERIVDQVVNPKIMTVFMPQVEDVVYKFLGIEKPKKGKENQNVYLAPLTVENLAKKEQKKLPTLTDLLPKELEPISPESDTLKGKEDNSLEDGEVGFADEKEEEDSSPPFEPIEKVSSHVEESSVDSHLSGISELTSHDSQHSHSIFNATATANITPSKPTLDLSNNDSQLSKVSSGSRLSIVSLGDQDFKLQYEAESNDESQQSKSSIHLSCSDGNAENIKKDIGGMKGGDNQETSGISEESNSSSNRLQIYTQENSENNSLDVKQIEEDENDAQGKELNERLENNISNKFGNLSFEVKIENKSEERGENTANEEPVQSVIIGIPMKNEITEGKVEIKTEEKLDSYQQEKFLEDVEDNMERKPEELEIVHEQKLELASKENANEKIDKKLDEKTPFSSGEFFERELNYKSDKHEKILDEKSERKSVENFEKKSNEKSERKSDEKHENKLDEKAEKHDKKIDDKSEKKSEKKYEKQLEGKADRRSSDKPEKKMDEKSTKKLDDKSMKKTDEKKSNDKRSDDKSDKKLDERKISEKRSDEKGDKKGEDKTDRKHDLKTDKKIDDKKHDKHKEEREKSKDRKEEKKKISSESKDLKKSDSNHSTESDKRKSDKYKKDHGENRSKSEKSMKHDSKEAKDKSKREEKFEKEATKEKSKHDIKENKDERKTEEKDKKNEKESGREKGRKDETEVSKHDKEVKKSKSDDKKERDGKEKQKIDERGRVKHDDKHKERIKSEGREKSDKDKSSRHDDKVKTSSRSSSKENKDISKQNVRDRGKDTSSKSDEKKNKDKLKHDEKSHKHTEKSDVKKAEGKSSRSSDHKTRESGKKNKESKGKSITDDHRIHRDKHSEDRRSADRDSNGTAQDRPIGNSTSHTNGSSDSQPSQSHREKSGSTSTSSKSDSGGNSDSSCVNGQPVESSGKEDRYSPSKSSSPPSSLPFKKRPLSIQSDDEHSDNERLNKSPKASRSKIKKPKIAANIFEVKKIMMLRKSLAKKERKQQRELQKTEGVEETIKNIKSEKKVSKPVVTKRKKLGAIEKSLRKEVHTSLSQKNIPIVNVEKEDLVEFKYFESETIPNPLNEFDSKFLAYVKQLVENDNLSDISTPESEISETDDVICLSNIDFDERVAKELGVRFVNTSKGTEVIFDESSDKEILKRRRASVEAVHGSMVNFNIVGDTVVTLNVSPRPNSAMSNWSENSADDYTTVDNAKRRRDRSSSDASLTSNKSISDKRKLSNCLDSGKHSDSSLKSRKRVFSRKKPKNDLTSPSEIKPIEKRELRRARRPNTRYSNKDFASYTDEDVSCDGFPSEQVTVNNIDDDSKLELKSGLVVVLNDFKSTATKFTGSGLHEDEDSSDREVILECVGDGYDIIKDNNNIDKGSSEDERGCGDGSMLNQDLILPTLRDLMVESGFRREDDKSEILPTLAEVGNCLTNNSYEDNNVKQVSSDTYSSGDKISSRRTSLGRSRRVGLSRPRQKVGTEQGKNEVGGNRTATPPDFVMPLSPESDVSASSGEARKALHDKVSGSHSDPSASNSNDKTAHVSNNRLTDLETRRSLRSGGLGTPGARGQRYNSDDLYKPRPLFSQGSRRVRGRVSPLNEDVPNCTNKMMSEISETPLPSVKKTR